MTINEFDRYVDELLDKMGSDYFPLPVKLNRFKSLALGFIRENTKFIQLTQEISEDLQPLFVRRYVNVAPTGDDSIKQISIPDDLFRLSSLKIFHSTNPIFTDDGTIENPEQNNTRIKKLNFIKDGQENAYQRDPYKMATPHYPNLLQYSGKYRIDFGTEPDMNYNKAVITYIKHPTFGRGLDDQIINLHDVLVERIALKTADSLRMGVGDESAPLNFEFNKRFTGNEKLT